MLDMVTVAQLIHPETFVLLTRYIQMISITLVIYDHILTIQEEVDFVWRGLHSRSWPRFIFLMARYAPPAVLLSNSFAIMGLHHSKTVSRVWLLFHGWSGFFFFAAVQVISQMRLWAIYRSKRLLYFMNVLIFLALLSMGMIEGLGYTNFNVNNTPINQDICGLNAELPHYVYAFWIPPLVLETISVSLVVYKAILYFRLGAPKTWGGSRFMDSIVRYSVLYFITVLCVYVANLYVWVTQKVFAFELFIPLTFALPSVTGNRMLLSLRGIFYEDNEELPGKNNLEMKVVNPERGLTIATHNPLKEFESFFGEIAAA